LHIPALEYLQAFSGKFFERIFDLKEDMIQVITTGECIDKVLLKWGIGFKRETIA